MNTTTQRLLDHLLADHGGLDSFVLEAREAGLSWRRLALEVWATTGESISFEALRGWYATREAA